MKIGFVLDDSLDKSDGVQQYVMTLGNWFRSQGHEVHYLVGETERTDIPHIHSLSRNIRARFNQNRMSTPLPASRERIRDIIAQHRFDVLHVQLPHSPLLAARVIRAAPLSTAVFGTFHIIPFSRLEAAAAAALGLILRRNLKRFDTIYSVSPPAQRFARQAFRIKSEVLPNAVNLMHYQTATPYKRYADDTITIVFLGRLVERKGCMHLLHAIERLHAKHKLDRVRVLVCGKGPLLPKLQRYVREKRLGHIVRFTGFVDEQAKAKYLAGADIAVFPSTGGESFGIVLIEAMAAGSKVVLAGDNAGYRSVMSDRKDQMIDPRDRAAFANVLQHFIASSRARNTARAWQQQHVVQYDVRRVGGHLLQEYESVIAKRQKSKHNKE